MFSVSLKKALDIQYEEIPEPVLGPGEVLIDVYASGICGSDMHRYVGEEPVKNPNIVCGHEYGGKVIAVADDVTDIKVGQNVAVNPAGSCGECKYCKAGLEYLCDHSKWTHAMAERTAAMAKMCVPMPDSFDMLYAPLVEPAATSIHACDGINNSNVVLIGLGTVGLFALQMLQKQGNKVVVADVSAYSLNLAKDFGAELVVNLKDEDANEQIIKLFDGEEPDWVLDGVGIAQTVERGIEVVKKRGIVRIFGASRMNIDFNCRLALLKEVTIESIYIYTEEDYRTMAKMFANDEIKYKETVSKVFPLREAKEAFEYKRTQPSTKILLKH